MKFTLSETTTSRVYTHLSNTENNCAIISPFRTEYSDSENRQRLAKLKNEVRELGYGYIEIIARWCEKDENGEMIYSDERSLLIPNFSPELAKKLGAKYEQSSIIIKEGSVCNEICTTPFISWDGDKEYKVGEIVRTFNLSSSKPLNIKDAEEIFARRKGGPASKPVKDTRAFTLSELYEVINTHNVATFSGQERVQRIF